MSNRDRGREDQHGLVRWVRTDEKDSASKVRTFDAQDPADYAEQAVGEGGDDTISTVPAFTDAASIATNARAEKKDGDVTDIKLLPRASRNNGFTPG